MQNEWILDVLADLKTFARQNGLSSLAEHLDDTQMIAAVEIASIGEGQSDHECGTAHAVGNDFAVPRRRC